MRAEKPKYRWIVRSITDEDGRRTITLWRIPTLKTSPALRFLKPAPTKGHRNATHLLNSR